MTDARRKAAEEWASNRPVIVVYDEQGNLLRHIGAKAEKMVTRQVEDAHLAGQESRQEEIDAKDAEIAALREAVRDIDGFIGTSPTNQLTEWHRWEKLPAVRRSLEEKL